VGLLIGAIFATESQAAVPTTAPSLADNFAIGSSGNSICRAQSLSNDPALKDMFDRAWSLVCRDAAAPVGRVYALRGTAADIDKRLDPTLTCAASSSSTLPDAGAAQVASCTGTIPGVGFRRYRIQRGATFYVAEGLAGYDSALTLALRSIVADRIVPGQVAVAITEAGNAAAFARVQAGNLDPDQALAEGYRRNNAGAYAEAAEFFDTLLQRRLGTGDPNRRYGEYVANQALQKSDLGQYAEADILFAEARRIPTSDPIELRLRRNLEAINDLNQGRLGPALAMLDKPVPPVGADSVPSLTIDPRLAASINSDAPMAQSLGVAATSQLTPAERAAILDAQAQGLRGVILRRRGNLAGATTAFNSMLARVAAIRGGNVASLARLRSQASGELAAIAEARGDRATAETLYRRSVSEISVEYPGSAAVTVTDARLAAFLGRIGKRDEARTLYRTVVANLSTGDTSVPGIDIMLEPYFSLLATQPGDAGAAAEFFVASQVLVRPGLAETQAILTRELSGGDDSASALFRQSTTLSRDIERQRVEVARLATVEKPTGNDIAGLTAARNSLSQIELQQSAIQAELSRFPRYRAVSNRGTTLAELQQTLKADEGYWKLVLAGGQVFGFYATPGRATMWAVPMSAAELDRTVDKIRDTIVVEVNGRQETHPFDAATARALYVALAGPVAAELPRVHNLIFDPDGAMLRLPANLLIVEQAGVDRYLARAASPTGDPFDMTGIAWLGRSVDISTSVSARAFEDVRKTPPSTATKPYIGLGHNAPVSAMAQLVGMPAATSLVDCSWPAEVWNHPISARELSTAAQAIGQPGAEIVTGEAFNDAALRARTDLNQFRIVHFATHGLVAAPRPGCPARPALLTSVAGAGSDGLLTFAEIFDMRLDADLVILSACNTASGAGDNATQEAGLTSGGGRALDGLVRAFVGAGSRSVLATHWVAPDDYDATGRLITGLFDASPGTPVAEALRQAQLVLMDKADTSHPYYWSAFALVGDGSQPLVRKR
jgi:CHAT domain-containing protein